MNRIDAHAPHWQWIAPEIAHSLSGTITTDRICRQVVTKAGRLSRLRRIGRDIVESWRLMLV